MTMTKKQAELQLKIAVNNAKKKYFPAVTPETKRLDASAFPEFVSTLMAVSVENAKTLITDLDVTVNGNLAYEITLELKSGDIVRVDTAHYVNN